MKTRHMIAIAATAIAFTACQQNSYKITGTVEGLDEGDTLFITSDLNTGIPSDTIIIKDGGFTKKGTADSASLTLIYAPNNPETSAMFFTEPGNITIHLGESATVTAIGGTKANEGLNELNTLAREYGNKMQELAANYFDPSISEESKLETMKQESDLQEELNSKVAALAEKNIDNELGYFIVTGISDDNIFTPEKRRELIEKMPANYRERQAVKNILKMMETIAQTAEGQTIPDFTMLTPENSDLSVMSEVKRNKLTILDFWASWCGPCRNEMPFMVELYKKYHEKGLGIVGISLDESKESWVNAIKELGILWPQMSDLGGWQSEGARLFQVNSIPFIVVVDQQGKILKKGLRGNDLEEFIEEQL
ncbi:MAG: AhpC/TSA family protein [Prevotella sp.]|nr:AhpC/TSA family protein [Prevotella sp.]